MAGFTKKDKSSKARHKEERREDQIENLETEIFSAIESLMIEKVVFIGGQKEEEVFLLRSVSLIREMDESAKKLQRLKHSLTKKTVSEMVKAIATGPSMDGDNFLSMISREYLTGKEKEKQTIINGIDLSELEDETFALVIRMLKRKGHFKKKKGFGV